MTDVQDGEQTTGDFFYLIQVGWPGGTLSLQVAGIPPVSDEAKGAIRAIMQQFSGDCQMMLAWFVGALNSRKAMQQTLDALAKSYEPLTISTMRPDGRVDVVLAQIPVEKVLESISADGEFETLFAKAFVVFTFQMWEDGTRPKIAAALHVAPNDINAPLMGEWRRLRNWLTHPFGDAEEDYFTNAKTLVSVLGSQLGNPNLTADKVLTLMPLLNNMSLTVDPQSVGVGFKLGPADPVMVAQIAESIEPNSGAAVPVTALMYPSPIVINFDDSIATIHERDCPHHNDEFNDVDGARQLIVPSREFALEVIGHMGRVVQQCSQCA